LEPLSGLLVRKIFATLQSVLTEPHGLGETGFFLEIARNNILQQLARIAALLSCGVRQLRFKFRGEMHFHASGSLSAYVRNPSQVFAGAFGNTAGTALATNNWSPCPIDWQGP
jgi:hypothetical protein